MRPPSRFRPVLLSLAVTVAAGSDLRGQTSADSAAAVVAAFHAALAAGDSTAALGLLAEDVAILESGGRESLAEYRSHHLPGDIKFAAAVPSRRNPPRVIVSGDAAWVVGTSETTGTIDGRAIDSAGAELVVLTRTAVGWRIRAIHWSSRRRQPTRP
ncbi:MAG: nuclear transport factor 2 family protein [Gemmatimonadales bacterium]|nr:nuclear transport factor 2 family protein [Gemmatimonadales bacterium]